MTLTPQLAEKIAARYGKLHLNVHGSFNDFEAALDRVIVRNGGLMASLTEDARRDLILTLGCTRRRHRRHHRADARIRARRDACAA